MCKAKHYTEQLLEIYNNIENELNTYNNKVNELEGLEMDVLHIIENENFNAVQGYKLAKMIKDARMERRDLKNEVQPLVTLKNSFIAKNVKELNNTYKMIQGLDKRLADLKENKVYKPRTLKTTELKLVVAR